MKFANFENAVTWAVKGLNESRGWIAEDYISVFRDFFEAYNLFEGREHPDISYPEMVQVLESMPWADSEEQVPLEPSEYVNLIGAYFYGTCPECDRNINQFFSGEIRQGLYFTMRGLD